MSSEAGEGSARVVIAALAGNLAIAISKFLAAYFSGSTAMLAEAVHSFSDTGNQVLLLVGMRLAMRPPDERHPFGRAGERYFWPFVVSLLLFSVGGVFAIYEGISRLRDPAEPQGNALWAYIVLGLSIAFELFSFTVAAREFREMRRGRSLGQMLHESRDVTIPLVLMEDTAALAGLFVAIVGVVASRAFGVTWADGVASLVIGALLCTCAVFLAYQTHGLLIGEAATREDRVQIERIVAAAPYVVRVVEVLTLHLGPGDVIVALKVAFEPHVSLAVLEDAINELERRVRAELPHMRRIFVEPDSVGDTVVPAPVPVLEPTAT